MIGLKSWLAVGVCTLCVVGGGLLAFDQTITPAPASTPGSGPGVLVQRIDRLPPNFARKYGMLLDLIAQLNAAQSEYLAAPTQMQQMSSTNRIQRLLEQIIAQANALKEDLENNRYVGVPGFSVGLGLPATLNFELDFTFKPKKGR